MNTIEAGSGFNLAHSSFSSSFGDDHATIQNIQKNDTSNESTLHKNKHQASPFEKVRIEQVEKAIRAAIGPEKRWEFSVHKELNEVMVKVINRETKEVIREVPPEKLLDMVAGMLKTAGLLIDKKW
ncbi:flagellar protein FlaG [Aneurinibacillus sp. UBA3580]|jgi:flagellar protein FlaG|uniref:flagellar protein FlaG n=1 Tax=Aneurinibacillus sp. UBA3580 TaxID=1946041 RepID=UPI00257CF320|nr:flagellar protein FlaG [Aneurinibacillus sp. UBA3580]